MVGDRALCRDAQAHPALILPGTFTAKYKYVVVASVLGFLLVLLLTDGSLMAAFGILALIAGMGWAVRRVTRARTR